MMKGETLRASSSSSIIQVVLFCPINTSNPRSEMYITADYILNALIAS